MTLLMMCIDIELLSKVADVSQNWLPIKTVVAAEANFLWRFDLNQLWTISTETELTVIVRKQVLCDTSKKTGK